MLGQVQVVAEQLQLVSPNSDGAHATDGVSASSHVDPSQHVLLEVALEATLVPDPSLDAVSTDGQAKPSLATGSSTEVLACSPEHVNTARGSLQPAENIEDLQSGLQGNWVTQINEYFSMAPSLLGLKRTQMVAASSNAPSISEEGMLLWKHHFK